MEIIWNGNLNKVPFEYVDLGHTFMYKGDIYIKTNSVNNANDNTIVNAVNIVNGMVTIFYDDEYVTPIKGKFIMD